MKKIVSVFLCVIMALSVIVPCASADGSVIVNFDWHSSVTTQFNTTVATEGLNLTEGTGCLRVDYTKPVGQPSNVGGQVYYEFASAADLSSYTELSLDFWLNNDLVGSGGLQINFITGTTATDGFNFMVGLDNMRSGWHTAEFTLANPNNGTHNNPSWSTINRIRITWFNYAQVSTPNVMLFDNLRDTSNSNVPTPPESSVVEPSSEAESSNEEESSSASSEEYYGDINDDGVVNSSDALMALQYSVQKVTLTDDQKIRADVVAPISVNSSDALAILQYSVKKITEFAPPERPEESEPEVSSEVSETPEASLPTVATYTYTTGQSPYTSGNFSIQSTTPIKVEGPVTAQQTDVGYTAMHNFDYDLNMVNVFGSGQVGSLAPYAEANGGEVAIFTPVNRGANAEYFARFPSRQGKDEQIKQNGTCQDHEVTGAYLIPSREFIQFKLDLLNECFKSVNDAGYKINAVVLEEPEIFVNATFSPGFKEEWQAYYGTAWQAYNSSVDARYKTSRLSVYLFERAFRLISEHVKKLSPDTLVILASHSAINYENYGITAGYGTYAKLDGIDGIIGQTWSDTLKQPMTLNNQSVTIPFLAGLVEYGQYAHGFEPNTYMYALGDPKSDVGSHTWDQYKSWYIDTVASQLMFAGINRYELMAWPSRCFQVAPKEYRTVQLNIFDAIKQSVGKETTLYSGMQGVYVGSSDSMTWQESITNNSPARSHQALTLALAEKGILPNSLNLDTLTSVDDLKNVRILILSYDYQKPLGETVNKSISDWVKQGGTLLYLGGHDALESASTEWWGQKGQTPFTNLLANLGINSSVSAYATTKGNFQWYAENGYCNSFLSASVNSTYNKYCMTFAGGGRGLLQKDGTAMGIDTAVGEGYFICLGMPTEWYSTLSNGSQLVREALRFASYKAGVDYIESNVVLMKRGNLISAHALGTAQTITGEFLDLTTANLAEKTSVTIPAGGSAILYDISSAKNDDGIPVVTVAGGTLHSFETQNNVSTFKWEGPSTSVGAMRIKCNGKTFDSISVTANGRNLTSQATVTYSSTFDTLLVELTFAKDWEHTLTINWK